MPAISRHANLRGKEKLNMERDFELNGLAPVLGKTSSNTGWNRIPQKQCP